MFDYSDTTVTPQQTEIADASSQPPVPSPAAQEPQGINVAHSADDFGKITAVSYENAQRPVALARVDAANVKSFQPQTMEELRRIALQVANSELIPKAYRGKPQDIIIAATFGAALGIPWLQSLCGVCVVNGRPTLYGDAFWSRITGADDFDGYTEEWVGTPGQNDYAVKIQIYRKNVRFPFTGTFSIHEAREAGLWGNNAWKHYWRTMLWWRAAGMAGRRAYAHRLNGAIEYREAADTMFEITGKYPQEPQAVKPMFGETSVNINAAAPRYAQPTTAITHVAAAFDDDVTPISDIAQQFKTPAHAQSAPPAQQPQDKNYGIDIVSADDPAVLAEERVARMESRVLDCSTIVALDALIPEVVRGGFTSEEQSRLRRIFASQKKYLGAQQ